MRSIIDIVVMSICLRLISPTSTRCHRSEIKMAYTELSRHVGSSRQLVTSARHVGLSR